MSPTLRHPAIVRGFNVFDDGKKFCIVQVPKLLLEDGRRPSAPAFIRSSEPPAPRPQELCPLGDLFAVARRYAFQQLPESVVRLKVRRCTSTDASADVACGMCDALRLAPTPQLYWCVQILAPLSHAVAFLHSRNIAHRDIKPESE